MIRKASFALPLGLIALASCAGLTPRGPSGRASAGSAAVASLERVPLLFFCPDPARHCDGFDGRIVVSTGGRVTLGSGVPLDRVSLDFWASVELAAPRPWCASPGDVGSIPEIQRLPLVLHCQGPRACYFEGTSIQVEPSGKITLPPGLGVDRAALDFWESLVSDAPRPWCMEEGGAPTSRAGEGLALDDRAATPCRARPGCSSDRSRARRSYR